MQIVENMRMNRHIETVIGLLYISKGALQHALIGTARSSILFGYSTFRTR
jgi:hypothetical protein